MTRLPHFAISPVLRTLLRAVETGLHLAYSSLPLPATLQRLKPKTSWLRGFWSSQPCSLHSSRPSGLPQIARNEFPYLDLRGSRELPLGQSKEIRGVKWNYFADASASSLCALHRRSILVIFNFTLGILTLPMLQASVIVRKCWRYSARQQPTSSFTWLTVGLQPGQANA